MWPYLKAHKLEKIRACWSKYFNEERSRRSYLIELTDKVTNMIADGFTHTSETSVPEMDEVQSRFDQL
jgi:hypothetical protein